VLVQYRRAAGVVWRRAHGSVFVLPDSGREVVVLTDTGEELWWLLAEPMTIDQAAHRLAEIYGVPDAAVSRDVAPVVDELAARGVLERG
jgi:hypothetical protein